MKLLRMFRFRRRAAFTLLELMISLAVLAALAVFALPRYADIIGRAKIAECQATRSVLERAEELYMNQNEGRLGTAGELAAAGYLDRTPVCLAGGSLVWISTSPLKLACSVHDISGVQDTVVASSGAAAGAGAAAGSAASGGSAAAAPVTLFSSGFSSMDGIDALTGAWRIKGGQLTVSSKGKSVNEVIVDGVAYTNYSTDLAATIYSGGFGVMYRASVDSGSRISGYSFQVNSSGKLELWTIVASKPVALLASSSLPSGFPATKVQHTVSVDVEGAQSTFFVDGVQVMQVTDSTFTSGTSGIRQWGGSAAFDSIVLTQI